MRILRTRPSGPLGHQTTRSDASIAPAMFGKRITLFRLVGFAVHVDLSWLILGFLVAWTLAVGYFPKALPALSKASIKRIDPSPAASAPSGARSMASSIGPTNGPGP